MAFEEYKAPESEGRSLDYVSVQVKKAAATKMMIVLGAEVVKKAEWKPGDCITMLFGTGDDKGKLLLIKAEEGKGIALAINGPKGQLKEGQIPTCRLGRVIKRQKPIEDFVDAEIKQEKVPFEWDDRQGGLLVTLPTGFFVQ